MPAMRHLSRVGLAAFALSVLLYALHPTAQTPARKKLLFLTHAGLYKHTSLGPAEAAVIDLGRSGGFDVTTLEGYKQDSNKIDLSVITPQYLAGFDGVMMMTNGNLPMTDDQKRALVEYVRSGKGLIGAHCATLTFYDYPEFGEMLGGYYLRSLIPTNLIGDANPGTLKVEDPRHPATKMLGASWQIGEEFYEFGNAPWDASRPNENISQVGRLHIPMAFSRDRVHVLLSLDTEHMDTTKLTLIKKGGDYPQAWERTFGRGRVFYTTLGHRDDIWGTDQMFRAHINGGIRWALGIEN